MSTTQEANTTSLHRHHSKATSAILAKGLHQPPSLCAQKVCVLLFFIVFQVIVSQKYRIVNILYEFRMKIFVEQLIKTHFNSTANKHTFRQPVILSEVRSTKSKFYRASSEVKSRCVAPQGYGLKFRWLFNGMLHLP